MNEIRLRLRSTFLVVCLLTAPLLAQDPREEAGFFTNPRSTSYGTLCSNNYSSALYLVQDGTIHELMSGAGCGSFFAVSPDGNRLGIKVIDETGLQTPSLFDLGNNTLFALSLPGRQMGQVSFAQDGTVAFTRGEELVVRSKSTEKTYPLGTYANLAPISPDGQMAAYNDRNDQLWIIDLRSSAKSMISDAAMGYFNPTWSPDGTKLLYSSLNGMVLVFDLVQSRTFNLGEGDHPSWSLDSRDVIFSRKEFAGPKLVNADIYIASSDGSDVRQLTSTDNVLEMDPSFSDGGHILFQTFDRRSICEAAVTPQGIKGQTLAAIKETVLPGPQNIRIQPLFPTSGAANITQLDIPYVHQAYDTPDWFNGDYACAPTQAIMLLAYYNILPPWPTRCSTPTLHYNNWGNYVCTQYQFRQSQYVYTAADASGRNSWGGYGYMWTGSYSPHTRMADYFRNHGLTAVQTDATPYSVAYSDVVAGYPFSMCVLLTSAGHLVLAHGIGAEPHTFVFNDPWGDKNRGYKNYYGKNASYDWPGYNNGYQNLTEVAWCIGTRYTPIAASDTVVDDLQFGKGFSMPLDAPASMTYWKDMNLGYQGHAWMATTLGTGPGDTCFATWTPSLPDDGRYEITAYVPSFATATDARYKITSSAGTVTVSINQNDHKDSWVSLGSYNFQKSTGGSVRLGDVSSVAGRLLGFDAIRWSRTQGLATEVSMNQAVPTAFALLQNYPNPFNPATTIRYQLPVAGTVTLTVFDVLGRKVSVLVNQLQSAGERSVTWNAGGVTSGIYYCQLRVVPVSGSGSPFVATMKMTVLK